MSAKPVTCEKCAFATWQRTPTGRIQKRFAGTCHAPDAQHIAAACDEIKTTRRYIWPDAKHFCPLYQPRQESSP